MLPFLDPPPPPPPPLRPAPPIKTLASSGSGHRSSFLSYSPSILIIAAIIAFVVVVSASIHLLLRLLSRPSPSPSPRFIHRLSTASASSSPSDQEDHKSLIDFLPIFSLSSSVAALPKSSLDCAVCLSPFHPAEELRLLPSCRHAFHSSCIDTWLKSTPSCPLCRSSIHPLPPPPPTPVPPVAPDPSRSGSFRIEIGSVSRRRTTSEEEPPHVRSYSLGSSFEYLVEEEVEAVLDRITRRPEGVKEEIKRAENISPPGTEVAESAGGAGRSWLKDYVDRLASSASSSFSSIQFSGRWGSHRFDGNGVTGGGGESWDLEGNQQLEEEDSGFSAFYRWLVGV